MAPKPKVAELVAKLASKDTEIQALQASLAKSEASRAKLKQYLEAFREQAVNTTQIIAQFQQLQQEHNGLKDEHRQLKQQNERLLQEREQQQRVQLQQQRRQEAAANSGLRGQQPQQADLQDIQQRFIDLQAEHQRAAQQLELLKAENQRLLLLREQETARRHGGDRKDTGQGPGQFCAPPGPSRGQDALEGQGQELRLRDEDLAAQLGQRAGPRQKQEQQGPHPVVAASTAPFTAPRAGSTLPGAAPTAARPAEAAPGATLTTAAAAGGAAGVRRAGGGGSAAQSAAASVVSSGGGSGSCDGSEQDSESDSDGDGTGGQGLDGTAPGGQRTGRRQGREVRRQRAEQRETDRERQRQQQELQLEREQWRQEQQQQQQQQQLLFEREQAVLREAAARAESERRAAEAALQAVRREVEELRRREAAQLAAMEELRAQLLALQALVAGHTSALDRHEAALSRQDDRLGRHDRELAAQRDAAAAGAARTGQLLERLEAAEAARREDAETLRGAERRLTGRLVAVEAGGSALRGRVEGMSAQLRAVVRTHSVLRRAFGGSGGEAALEGPEGWGDEGMQRGVEGLEAPGAGRTGRGERWGVGDDRRLEQVGGQVAGPASLPWRALPAEPPEVQVADMETEAHQGYDEDEEEEGVGYQDLQQGGDLAPAAAAAAQEERRHLEEGPPGSEAGRDAAERHRDKRRRLDVTGPSGDILQPAQQHPQPQPQLQPTARPNDIAAAAAAAVPAVGGGVGGPLPRPRQPFAAPPGPVLPPGLPPPPLPLPTSPKSPSGAAAEPWAQQQRRGRGRPRKERAPAELLATLLDGKAAGQVMMAKIASAAARRAAEAVRAGVIHPAPLAAAVCSAVLRCCRAAVGLPGPVQPPPPPPAAAGAATADGAPGVAGGEGADAAAGSGGAGDRSMAPGNGGGRAATRGRAQAGPGGLGSGTVAGSGPPDVGWLAALPGFATVRGRGGAGSASSAAAAGGPGPGMGTGTGGGGAAGLQDALVSLWCRPADQQRQVVRWLLQVVREADMQLATGPQPRPAKTGQRPAGGPVADANGGADLSPTAGERRDEDMPEVDLEVEVGTGPQPTPAGLPSARPGQQPEEDPARAAHAERDEAPGRARGQVLGSLLAQQLSVLTCSFPANTGAPGPAATDPAEAAAVPAFDTDLPRRRHPDDAASEPGTVQGDDVAAVAAGAAQSAAAAAAVPPPRSAASAGVPASPSERCAAAHALAQLLRLYRDVEGFCSAALDLVHLAAAARASSSPASTGARTRCERGRAGGHEGQPRAEAAEAEADGAAGVRNEGSSCGGGGRAPGVGMATLPEDAASVVPLAAFVASWPTALLPADPLTVAATPPDAAAAAGAAETNGSGYEDPEVPAADGTREVGTVEATGGNDEGGVAGEAIGSANAAVVDVGKRQASPAPYWGPSLERCLVAQPLAVAAALVVQVLALERLAACLAAAVPEPSSAAPAAPAPAPALVSATGHGTLDQQALPSAGATSGAEAATATAATSPGPGLPTAVLPLPLPPIPGVPPSLDLQAEAVAAAALLRILSEAQQPADQAGGSGGRAAAGPMTMSTPVRVALWGPPSAPVFMLPGVSEVLAVAGAGVSRSHAGPGPEGTARAAGGAGSETAGIPSGQGRGGGKQQQQHRRAAQANGATATAGEESWRAGCARGSDQAAALDRALAAALRQAHAALTELASRLVGLMMAGLGLRLGLGLKERRGSEDDPRARAGRETSAAPRTEGGCAARPRILQAAAPGSGGSSDAHLRAQSPPTGPAQVEQDLELGLGPGLKPRCSAYLQELHQALMLACHMLPNGEVYGRVLRPAVSWLVAGGPLPEKRDPGSGRTRATTDPVTLEGAAAEEEARGAVDTAEAEADAGAGAAEAWDVDESVTGGAGVGVPAEAPGGSLVPRSQARGTATRSHAPQRSAGPSGLAASARAVVRDPEAARVLLRLVQDVACQALCSSLTTRDSDSSSSSGAARGPSDDGDRSGGTGGMDCPLAMGVACAAVAEALAGLMPALHSVGSAGPGDPAGPGAPGSAEAPGGVGKGAEAEAGGGAYAPAVQADLARTVTRVAAMCLAGSSGRAGQAPRRRHPRAVPGPLQSGDVLPAGAPVAAPQHAGVGSGDADGCSGEEGEDGPVVRLQASVARSLQAVRRWGPPGLLHVGNAGQPARAGAAGGGGPAHERTAWAPPAASE